MKKVLLVFMSFWVYQVTYAQQTVSGKITSEGEALPGVSVIIKDTNIGTVSDVNGDYSLQVPEDNGTLVFSFIGFATQEVAISNRTTIDVSMEEDLTELSEVVVIGYGTQKKKLVTGATANVGGEQLVKMNNTNALQALQGQTAGVNITSTSGQPGAGYEVNIRGVGTIGNSNPLYIVDGLPTGDISYLNNSDIESIDILKDAAAAAIYGSRAANGVVLVTTKQGKEGKTQISFDSYYGAQTVADKMELLNAREYATIMNEQAINSGKPLYYSSDQIAAMGEGTNWLDKILVDDAVTQNYALGIQGGNKVSTYSTSLSYTQQEGVVGGEDYSDYQRYVLRLNSEHKLYKDKIKVGENLTFTYTDQVGIADGGQYYNNFRGAFNTNPLIPVYDSAGNFYDNSPGEFIDKGTQANPYAQLVYANQKKNSNQRIVGNVYLEAEPVKDLSFRSTFGISLGTGQSRSYTPVYKLSIYSFNDTSSVSQSSYQNLSWNWENTVRYKRQFGAHQIEALLGTSAQKWTGSNVSANNANLSFDQLKYAYLDNTTYANGVRMSVGGGGYEDMLQSYFGRVLYNYNEKYLFNATFRADGSAKFAKGHRWGYFPSFSAGWVISNEGFYDGLSLPVDFFKLRASWGQNGSNFIDGFQYLAPIQLSNTNYIFGNQEGKLTPGAYPNRLSNPAVKWETSEQFDIGFDAEFLDGRLFANFDWYQKTTKDWLIQAPILATAGADAPFINGGDVVNRGVELVLGWRERKGDLTYNITVNGAYNENNVNSIPTEDGIIHGESNELWNNAPEFYRAQTGFPIGYFWGYETGGVFQNEAEVNAYRNGEGELLQKGALPGDLIYKDTNHDGKITNDDKTMIGDPNPDIVYGFNVNVGYKGFDISISANGVAGNQLVQSYRSLTDQYSNYTQEILGRWHGEGTSNELPRLTENSKNYAEFSDIYIKDGDFLRINNITIGYDLARFINNENFSKVRVFVTGQNLFTFTKYSGMDPEIGYGQTFARGVDVGYYPRPRVLMAGLNVNF